MLIPNTEKLLFSTFRSLQVNSIYLLARIGASSCRALEVFLIPSSRIAWLIPWLSDHTEFTDEVKGFLHIQVQRFETRINTHVIFIKAFAFSNALQGFDRSADELRYIIDPCEYLCI